MAPPAPGIIDTNCYLGSWPTRRLAIGSPRELGQLALDNGVVTCLVSPLEAIFHKDRITANSKLKREIANFRSSLIPIPVVNPLAPVEESGNVKMVRVTPAHHLYSVRNRALNRLMAMLESGGKVLFISMRMRDERLRHPILRTRPIRPDELISALEPFPDLPVVVNNAKSAEMERILQNCGDNVLVGCTWSMPVGFIERMVDDHGDHRMVFGSNVPLHYYQSSLLQINGASISSRSRDRILRENAGALL